MWVLFWKKYPISKFATFVSIVGALTRYAGVMCLFAAAIPAALICIAIGIGIHFCAEGIAKSKAARVARKANAAKAADSAPKTAAAQPTAEPEQAAPAPSAAAQPTTEADEESKCGKCGTPASADDVFCTECGSEIPKEKKCVKCGNALEEDDKFCSQCGQQSN